MNIVELNQKEISLVSGSFCGLNYLSSALNSAGEFASLKWLLLHF